MSDASHLTADEIRDQDEARTRAAKDLMRIVIVGHVDHGKSTLVGRLFYDTGSLPDGKFEAIQAMCERRGMPFEWAFLMDALQAERDQGITIDTTQIWFNTDKRDYVIIDAPGHTEFLKNMITGAASSDAAVLVIDADEGVQEQSRRHGYLLHLMGIRQVTVAVNKMDLCDYSEERFKVVEAEYRDYLNSIGVTPTFVIPVSAREGDAIASIGDNMPWYKGPTIVDALDAFEPVPSATDKPLRFPIQDIYKFDERRILAGRIESGSLSVGDTLLFSPSNKTAKVQSLEAWSVPQLPNRADAGYSVGVTLDQQLFVERGELASHKENPPIETDVFKARIFWLGHKSLEVGKRYKMKLNTLSVPVTVQAIEHVINTTDLSETKATSVERNSVGEIILRADRLIALDPFSDLAGTGRFVLVDDFDIAGGGIISMEGYADQRSFQTIASSNIQPVEHDVSVDARKTRNGHLGGVMWFTGLSGSGKSTLAVEVEKQLFAEGYQVYVLDGDNVRSGLNANVDFSPEGRAENIRRIGEVAGLFARAGIIAITSFISPYRSDRDRARLVMGGSGFHEIYISADLETCEQRDPKGLYKKARSGEIADFTGIGAPYEAPDTPELVIDTAANDVESCVKEIIVYVKAHFEVDASRLESQTLH